MPSLRIYAGRVARERLAEHGFDVELFSLLLGASGGAKWLVLSRLDRVLASELLSKRATPLDAFGTSIGSWRHACFAQEDPVAALTRMEEGYIEQRYDEKPDAAEVTRVCVEILNAVLGPAEGRDIIENPRIRTHIGTARGLGIAGSTARPLQTAVLVGAALANTVSRSLLQSWYQRVIFSSDGEARNLGFDDFRTEHVTLGQSNLFDALMASASIPLVLEGVPNPGGAPPGHYWDGGIVDYHHDLRLHRGDGLVLYPHFYGTITPGWFDKALSKRRARGTLLDRVVLLAPDPELVEKLPHGRIPDRKDFARMGNDERIASWRRTVAETDRMAEELASILASRDPLEHVQPFPEAP